MGPLRVRRVPLPVTRGLDRLVHPVLVDRIIYATITIMSVLIIYDGWQHLKLIDVAGAIIGPVLAMFLAHVFSAAMAQHVKARRILTGKEWRAVVRVQAPFLALCVPPLAIVSLLYAVGVSLSDGIRVTLWVGTASLGYWGLVAGRRAGFRRLVTGHGRHRWSPDRGGHSADSGPSSARQSVFGRSCLRSSSYLWPPLRPYAGTVGHSGTSRARKCSAPSGLDEGQQIGVDRLGLGGRHPVWETGVGLQRPVLNELRRRGDLSRRRGRSGRRLRASRARAQ